MTDEKYREQLKKLRNGYRGHPAATVTREQLEAELDSKLSLGLITVPEAEEEWQDKVNPEPRYSGREW